MATQIDLGTVVPIGKGDWNIDTTYERANIVGHNSVAWICKVESSTGVEPTEDSSDWYLLVKDTSSVTSVNGQKGDITLDIISSSQVDNKINTEINNVKSEINNKIPSIMVGASDEISGKSGIVPAPTAGSQNRPLRGDGTWAESLDCAVSRLYSEYLTSDMTDTKEWWLAKGNSIFSVNINGLIHNQPNQYGTIINTVVGVELQQLFLTQPNGDVYKRGANGTGWNGHADDNGKWEKLSNSMPIGAIYVQFSGQSAPANIFGGTWSNVSSSYAGRFFRAEGGSAAAFGKTQADAAPNIKASANGIETYKSKSASGAFTYSNPLINNAIGSGSDFGSIVLNFDASRSNGKYGDASEFRPINSTIRIWKRTA